MMPWIHKGMRDMEDEKRQKLVRELLEIGYRLHLTSCRIQKMTPLEFKDWVLKRCEVNCAQ